MNIYDPIAETLGMTPFLDIKDYPTIDPISSHIPGWNKGIKGTTTLGMKFGPMSEDRKRKISEAKKGSVPWNKGKQGKRPKGIVCKEETKRKISEAKKGKPRSEASINADAQRSKSLKGRVFTAEHKEKLRQAAIKRYSTCST